MNWQIILPFLLSAALLLPTADQVHTNLQTEEMNTIIVDQKRMVIPDILEVSNTASGYAHGQHLVWVDGRFKHKEGDLFIILLDPQGNKLTHDFTKAEIVEPIDGEWVKFSHKLAEDTGKVIKLDEAVIVFELRKENKTVHSGKLAVPLASPVN